MTMAFDTDKERREALDGFLLATRTLFEMPVKEADLQLADYWFTKWRQRNRRGCFYDQERSV